jgi:hypothetical protein
MSTKKKIAEILAARDNLPVDDIVSQLDQMIEEMRDAAEYDDFELDLEGIWTEWTGLEPDYFAEFVMENL